MENNKNSGSKNFECTICLDTAKEPVLTRCGHMFCWPCIYNWLDSKEGKTKCPNCKNEITIHDLIPVYSSNESQENTNRFKKIPKRPKADINSEDYDIEEYEYHGRLLFFSFNCGRLLSHLKTKLNIFNYLDLVNINNLENSNNNIHNDNFQDNNIQDIDIKNSEIQNSNNQNSNNNNQRESSFLNWIPENTLKTIINFIKFFLVFLLLLQLTKFKIF